MVCRRGRYQAAAYMKVWWRMAPRRLLRVSCRAGRTGNKAARWLCNLTDHAFVGIEHRTERQTRISSFSSKTFSCTGGMTGDHGLACAAAFRAADRRVVRWCRAASAGLKSSRRVAALLTGINAVVPQSPRRISARCRVNRSVNADEQMAPRRRRRARLGGRRRQWRAGRHRSDPGAEQGVPAV